MRLIRAQAFCSWEGKSDAELLANFIVTRKQRGAMPVIGDPQPDALWRLGTFHTAVGLVIEKRSGLMTSPMTIMKARALRTIAFYGRAVGSLCRDIHPVRLQDAHAAAEAGTKLIDDPTAAIEAYPDVARA
ncbi:DUF269 domain-containing protein [Mesorhizobium australicum]|uniref:DUF269 domain-containing protein n=1 Tax=Mesorhizobium australicum TaxID=536018 RepID=UPI003EBEAD55